MRTRILYTTADTSPQSGAFRSLLSMSQGVAENGYDAVLALHSQGKESALLAPELREHTHFLDLPRPKRRQSIDYYYGYLSQNASSIWQLVRLIREESISLVHINEVLDIYGGIAARLAGVPSVWHARADLSTAPLLRDLMSRAVLALATQIVVVSSSVHQRLFDGRGENKVVTIHDPGPNPNEFHPGVDGCPVRKELGLPKHVPLVTLVAKMAEVKGHETLVRAAPRVLIAHPNTRFLLVGGELEGAHHREYANRLKRLVRELGLEKKVIFAGFRTDIAAVLAASDIVTHCSTYPDPFPGVVLQGMAVGRPIIASDLGGPREQLEHKISGLLVEPENHIVLSNAISRLLSNPRERREMGLRAFKASQQFSQASFYSKLFSVYGELTDG